MIEVYADDRLVYSPHLPEYELEALQANVSATASGTATITMPPGHPAMDAFTSYKTVVTIYRRGLLLFRGRVLYSTDDFYKRRTITCEGERGFLQDSVVRPGKFYNTSPATVFSDLIENHNTQVDASKTFVVGDVTAGSANVFVNIAITTAEQTAVALDLLIAQAGGYIVFTTNDEGQRVINWYEEPGYKSEQAIEFGENLLDYSRTTAGTDMVTAILPYGGVDEETGNRITIESVNDGLDYIQDDEAVELRGFILRPMYWDDALDPTTLKTRAERALSKMRNIVSSLQLTAVDMSALSQDIDTFQVLDLVHVISQPHGVDEEFLLTDRHYDLLNPDLDTIVMGKEVLTLSSEGAAGDRNNRNELHKVETDIREDYEKDVEQAIQNTTEQLSSLIQQTESAIRTEVSETYLTGEEVDERISTSMTQTAEGWIYEFEALEKKVNENDADARAQYEERKKYIRFIDGNIHLGEESNTLELKIQKDRISFYDDGAEVAFFSNKKLTVKDGNFLNSVQVGNFALLPRDNDNLSLVKVG